jgi:hypothetical protein
MTDLPVAKQSKFVFLDQAGDERLHPLFQEAIRMLSMVHRKPEPQTFLQQLRQLRHVGNNQSLENFRQLRKVRRNPPRLMQVQLVSPKGVAKPQVRT